MEYRQYNHKTFAASHYYQRLPKTARLEFDVLTQVFPFKANSYVLENLIDWDNIPNDPMYKLVFPRKEMLGTNEFRNLQKLLHEKDAESKNELIASIRARLSPRVPYAPSCIPIHNGIPVKGAYRSWKSVLALFAKPTLSTCHNYCSYCFRWDTLGEPESLQSGYNDPDEPIAYLRAHPEISDVMFTGADPMVIKASTLRKYIEPLLAISSLKAISITTKSLAWWPYRYTTDKDAQDVLDLFAEICANGKHLNFYAHFTHDRELAHEEVVKASMRIRSTGAVIRTHGPLVIGINDNAETWARLWTKQIQLGMVPDWMYLEADHSPESCFRVSLAESLQIAEEAHRQCSVLARTVRGPVFMNDVYRVLLDGVTELNGEKYFVLKNLHGPPDSNAESTIKLIRYDAQTKSVGDLFELFHQPAICERPLVLA
jgi:L-lysine 2,3-aminomutase